MQRDFLPPSNVPGLMSTRRVSSVSADTPPPPPNGREGDESNRIESDDVPNSSKEFIRGEEISHDPGFSNLDLVFSPVDRCLNKIKEEGKFRFPVSPKKKEKKEKEASAIRIERVESERT